MAVQFKDDAVLTRQHVKHSAKPTGHSNQNNAYWPMVTWIWPKPYTCQHTIKCAAKITEPLQQ